MDVSCLCLDTNSVTIELTWQFLIRHWNPTVVVFLEQSSFKSAAAPVTKPRPQGQPNGPPLSNGNKLYCEPHARAAKATQNIGQSMGGMGGGTPQQVQVMLIHVVPNLQWHSLLFQSQMMHAGNGMQQKHQTPKNWKQTLDQDKAGAATNAEDFTKQFMAQMYGGTGGQQPQQQSKTILWSKQILWLTNHSFQVHLKWCNPIGQLQTAFSNNSSSLNNRLLLRMISWDWGLTIMEYLLTEPTDPATVPPVQSRYFGCETEFWRCCDHFEQTEERFVLCPVFYSCLCLQIR